MTRTARELTRIGLVFLAAGCVHDASVTGRAPENPTRERPNTVAAKPRKRADVYADREAAEKAGEKAEFERADPALARIGVASTRVMHRKNCPALEGVPSSEQVPFTSKFDAFDEGYRPCEDCRSN
jgi:hypothetical protein